ncbi:MAG TPA: molecular chaperone DnaJ [Terriglobales bacterium]|nr:molecular chaperone DnaJ [Terriglobales bacterium]
MGLATNAKRDYYEVLSVERSASEQEIKSSYRKLAMQYHPDRNPGNPQAEEKFKEATEAYSVLMDANKRAQYDRFGHQGVNFGSGGVEGFPFQDLNDIFGDLFGIGDLFGTGAGSGRRRSRAQQGNDVRYDLALEFEEAVFGKSTEIKVRTYAECEACNGSGSEPGHSSTTCNSCGGRGQVRFQQGFFSVSRTCSRCNGTGSTISHPCNACKGQGRVVREKTIGVKVPAGVEHGTKILFTGEGEAGVNGGPAGDLYVVLNVKEHAFFEREGKDLYCVVPISFPQAALGAEITIPTLDGDHSLSIPAGTQSGATLRIKNKGVPVLRGSGRGDLYVQVRVQTPSKLTRNQKEMLYLLQDSLQVENKPERKTLFSKVKDIFS